MTKARILIVLTMMLGVVSGIHARVFKTLPLVEEGKQWFYATKYEDGSREFPYTYSYLIHGDTIIAGYPSKKVYRVTPDNESGTYFASLREDYGRVYAAKAGEMWFSLLYDFGLEEMEEAIYENGIVAKLLEVRSLYGLDGKIHRTYGFVFNKIGDEGAIPKRRYYWYEGAGTVVHGCDLFDYNPFHVKDIEFLGCYVYDTCVLPPSYGAVMNFIVKGWEFMEETVPVRAAEKDCNSFTAPAYDLQGRRVNSTAPRRGVYVKNGKKIIDN